MTIPSPPCRLVSPLFVDCDIGGGGWGLKFEIINMENDHVRTKLQNENETREKSSQIH